MTLPGIVNDPITCLSINPDKTFNDVVNETLPTNLNARYYNNGHYGD